MANFAQTPRPHTSPWGGVQAADQLLPGAWLITTASHGGIMLSNERQSAMPDELSVPDGAYEEDIDWALIFVAFADEIRATGDRALAVQIDLARATVKTWLPDRWTEHTGEAVTVSDSHFIRRRTAYAAALGRHVSHAAWGSWADWVPAGKVGVVASIVASVDKTGFARFVPGSEIHALVEAADYEARGDVFVLDEHPHDIVSPDAPITKRVQIA